jgi:hypothetical protein
MNRFCSAALRPMITTDWERAFAGVTGMVRRVAMRTVRMEFIVKREERW